MKKLIHTIFLISTFFASAHAQTLPSADEVINKYINALGGKKALMKIKDLSFELSIANSGGNSSLTNMYKMPDKRLILASDASGKVVYQQLISGKKVSTKSGDNMIPTTPEDLQRAIMGAYFIPELTLSENRIKYTLAGNETLNGKETYKIIYTGADGTALWTAYYDTQTGLLARNLTPWQDGPQTMDYTDYREVNGIKVPYHYKGYGSEFQVRKCEVNKGLSDAEFVIK